MVQRKQLFIGGKETVSLASGDGTATITFSDKNLTFRTTPVIMLTINDDQGGDNAWNLFASSISPTGFTINVFSASAETSIDIGWIAIERLPAEQ